MEGRHAGKIDLLLTDMVMPRMNGRVLAERLLLKRPGTRVQYITGYTDSFIAGHGAHERGMVLLHKPFTEEALIRKVREVLDAKVEAAGEPESSELISQDRRDPS